MSDAGMELAYRLSAKWVRTSEQLSEANARIDAALAVLDALHDHGAHRAAAILRGETS